MAEHPINELLKNSLENLRTLVDANTIIGEAVKTDGGITVIPISKVAFGFGSGGSDLPSSNPKFGGGSGGGVSITPVAFIVINAGEVKLLQIQTSENTADKIVNTVPDLIEKLSGLFAKPKKNKDEEAK